MSILNLDSHMLVLLCASGCSLHALRFANWLVALSPRLQQHYTRFPSSHNADLVDKQWQSFVPPMVTNWSASALICVLICEPICSPNWSSSQSSNRTNCSSKHGKRIISWLSCVTGLFALIIHITNNRISISSSTCSSSRQDRKETLGSDTNQCKKCSGLQN